MNPPCNVVMEVAEGSHIADDPSPESPRFRSSDNLAEPTKDCPRLKCPVFGDFSEKYRQCQTVCQGPLELAQHLVQDHQESRFRLFHSPICLFWGSSTQDLAQHLTTYHDPDAPPTSTSACLGPPWFVPLPTLDASGTTNDVPTSRSSPRGRSYDAWQLGSTPARRDSSASSVRSMIDDRMRMADEERGRTGYTIPVCSQSPFRDGSPFEGEYVWSRTRSDNSLQLSAYGIIEDAAKGGNLSFTHPKEESSVASALCCDRCRRFGFSVSQRLCRFEAETCQVCGKCCFTCGLR